MVDLNSEIDREMAQSQRLRLWAVTATLSRPMGELEAHLAGHFAFVRQQCATGTIFAAGPLLSESEENVGNGLMIFRAETRQDVLDLLEQDPLYAQGVREYAVAAWQVNVGSITLNVDIGSSCGSVC